MSGKYDLHQYQLRYAAGLYWLLDMGQSGQNYHRPLPLNAAAAEIWQSLVNGEKTEEIADMICRKYGTSKEEAMSDVREFFEQLAAEGILRDEGKNQG